MGAAFNSKQENTDDANTLQQLDKACQTDVHISTPTTTTTTNITVIYETTNKDKTDLQRDITLNKIDLEKMRQEIEFVKTELVSKQKTTENLFELLKSNLDVTKELSRVITSNSFNTEDYADVSWTRENQRNTVNNNSKLCAELYDQLILLQRRCFEESLNSHLTSTKYDIFVDSLEE